MRHFALLLAFLLMPEYTNACACDKPRRVDDPNVRKYADIVFLGEVIDVAMTPTLYGSHAVVRFKVLETTLGDHTETIVVEMDEGWTSCDLEPLAFVIGDRYLMSGIRFSRNADVDDPMPLPTSDDRYQNNFCSLRERVSATPNNALERTVRTSVVGAAGATEIIAPAAPGNCWRAAAQRKR